MSFTEKLDETTVGTSPGTIYQSDRTPLFISTSTRPPGGKFQGQVVIVQVDINSLHSVRSRASFIE